MVRFAPVSYWAGRVRRESAGGGPHALELGSWERSCVVHGAEAAPIGIGAWVRGVGW